MLRRETVLPTKTFRLAGELDISGAAAIEPLVDQMLACGGGVCAIDMSDVRFMDSSGVRALLQGLARMQEQGSRFYLVNTRRPLCRLLLLLGCRALTRR
jgi:anti-anti-sigma factor